MNKEELKKIKAEIKQEMISEEKEKTIKKMNSDVESINNFIKNNKWYWFIPLFGWLIYIIQMSKLNLNFKLNLSRLNFGKCIMQTFWIYFLILFTIIFYMVINLLPIYFKSVFIKTIKMTTEEVNNNVNNL